MKNQKRRRVFETKNTTATDHGLSDWPFVVVDDSDTDVQARGEAATSHLPSQRN
jgi:hypothetical protein